MTEVSSTDVPNNFSIDDDPLNLPELESEAKLHVLETQRQLQEIEKLRASVEELARDNKRLTAELALFHEEENMSIDDFLGKAPTKGTSKEIARQLDEERLHATLAENKKLVEERDSLRQDFAAAQLDWSLQLKEEQTRIESFKAILRDVEDHAKSQRRALELEVSTLRQEQQTLRGKIHEEFSEQLRAKTELVGEFDVKLQQAMGRQSDLNQKLVVAKQQLEHCNHICQKQQQTIQDLGREKEKLLTETYDIRVSLETKCSELHSTVLQLEHRLKESLAIMPEAKHEQSGESLAHLRAKQQLAKREMLKVVGDLVEQKRKFAEAEADHKLELTRLKNVLSEFQKVLKLETFTLDEGERDTLHAKSQAFQGDSLNFHELGGEALGARVAALAASCDKLSSLGEGKEALDMQTLRGEVGVMRDNVTGMARCMSALARHQSEVSAHLSSVSARVYDDASCVTGLKLIVRAVRKCCSKPAQAKRHRYAQVEIEETESP